jgi:hypothetical protein
MRKETVVIGLFVLSILFLSGCDLNAIMNENGNRISIKEYLKPGLTITKEYSLTAKLTGSIYETGDIITVFGVCMTSDDEPIDTDVSLTVFYPNGTQAIYTDSLNHIKTGYWFYTGTMQPVIGTYLTILNCSLNGSTALSFGEWQNPIWVNRLAPIMQMSNETNSVVKDINGTVIAINSSVQNIQNTLNDLNVSLDSFANATNESFQILFTKIDGINSTIVDNFNYTNWLIQNINMSAPIYYGACVANHSVDRNDSYLAKLLLNIAKTVKAPITGSFTFYEQARFPIHSDNWWIKGRPLDEYGTWHDNDDVYCQISIYDDDIFLNENMSWKGAEAIGNCEKFFGKNNCNDDDSVKGYFYYNYFITGRENFNYSINCRYINPPENLTVYYEC